MEARTLFPSGFDSSLGDFMRQCETSVNLRSQYIPFLEKLAVEGFVPADTSDPLSMLAVKCNIAGYVSERAETPWIARSARCPGESGVVPSLESMRVVIALRLSRRKREGKDIGGTQSTLRRINKQYEGETDKVRKNKPIEEEESSFFRFFFCKLIVGFLKFFR